MAMRTSQARRAATTRRPPADKGGRPSIGIRELKAKASTIVQDVKGRRVAYAVTNRGTVAALIVPVDVGERLSGQPPAAAAWDAWQALATRLAKEPGTKDSSAVAELDRMRR